MLLSKMNYKTMRERQTERNAKLHEKYQWNKSPGEMGWTYTST